MKVYVETNFVLELVLKQEQSEHCREILELNRSGQCRVCVPALALAEAYTAIVGMRKSRERLEHDLSRQVSELGRREPYRHLPGSFQLLSKELTSAEAQENDGLAQVTVQLLTEVEVLPIDQVTLLFVQGAIVGRYALELPDATMLAAVILHAQRSGEPGLFLNRNYKDFDVPDIKDLLAQHNCQFSRSFAEGARLIRSQQS